MNLHDTQLVILSAAAQRDDGLAWPVPDSITSEEERVRNRLRSLVRVGYLQERRAEFNEDGWREDKAGRPYTLEVTAAGLAAISVEPTEHPLYAPRVRSRTRS